MEKEDSTPPKPRKISLQRRWAHEYALTQPGYDVSPLSISDVGAPLTSFTGPPMPNYEQRGFPDHPAWHPAATKNLPISDTQP